MIQTIRMTTLAAVFVGSIAAASIQASAQSSPPFVASAVELEIAPADLDAFLAILKANGAESIKEPGCRRYDILQSATNPNQVFIFEVYDNEAAVQAHRTTEHFKAYIAATRSMVVKRQSRPLNAVASYAK